MTNTNAKPEVLVLAGNFVDFGLGLGSICGREGVLMNVYGR